MIFLKVILVRLLTKFYRHRWSEKKFKILVYEKKLSRRQIIQSELQDLDLSNEIQIIYVKRRDLYLGLIEDADIIYSYGVNRLLSPLRPRLMYIPVIGGDPQYSNDRLTVVKPPNFACGYVADYVMAAVLAYERGLLQNASQRKNLSWDQDSYVQAVTRKLSEIRIGVLGLGCIGENVAQSFVSFGCEVWAYDKDQTRGEELRGIKLCTDMNSLLSQSDYLIVAVSDNENKDLISGKEFMRMNKGICIVNVSRGSVVNEDAMIKAIAQGEIRGAILDVLNKEPISRFSKIRRLPNIVITPHIAGNIDLVYQDIARHFKGTIINRINV